MTNHLEPRFDLGSFNGWFLLWSCIFGLVAVLFLFYFNRLVAFALFGVIRAYTWLFYKVHIRCQAIQFSLLGGRIFLRGIEYHGENETIVVHQAYITWRYWYRRVAEVDLRPRNVAKGDSTTGSSGEQSGGHEKPSDSEQQAGHEGGRHQAPCRISVHIRGIEWFVHNRSPAFDAIIASAFKPTTHRSSPEGDEVDAEAVAGVERHHAKRKVEDARESLQSGGSTARPPYQPFVEKPQADVPFFLKMLPISVECTKAAMVMGNHHTRIVMVAKIDRAIGQVTATACGIFDKYRQHFDFQFIRPVIRFSPNEDYIEPLLTAGARINGIEGRGDSTGLEQNKKRPPKKVRHRARHALSRLIPQFQRSVRSFDRRSGSVQRDTDTTILEGGLPGQASWMGLTRYLDEEEEDKLEHEKWRRIEYAEEQVVADCPLVSMDFYWDVPGSISHVNGDGFGAADSLCEVNGSAPPEWGLEIRVDGGNVNYGPWADRQRVDLMLMFFPSAYSTAIPAVPLRPGQTRISTVFKIAIIIDDKVTLRLHTREPSKDWKFKGADNGKSEGGRPENKRKQPRSRNTAQKAFEPHDRAAGWLDVSFNANTSVSYDMDMMAGKSGFKNKLRMDVVSPTVTSSVNSALILRAASLAVDCDLSNPPTWNAKRTWKFDVASGQLELFMLREHAFLIQDLVEDFTAGPAAEFYTFVPFRYELGLVFDDFKVYLNANDLNIIDRPADPNDNNFLVLDSRKVIASIGIPADQLGAIKNSITFDGTLHNTAFRVNSPSWNTYSTLLQEPDLGNFPSIVAKGSYNYFSSTSPALTDTLLMQIHGDRPKLRLYGFLIRLFMTFRDNYFGEDVHFQTIEEYQARLQKPGRKHAADNDHKPVNQSNDLDVILSITTKNPSVLLPSKLYSADDCVQIDLESGNADLRFTNYYMDLQTTLSPLSLSHQVSMKAPTPRDADDVGVKTFVDGVSITGHRLFGLPPTEPTYVCNWDFDVGAITGEASIDYLGALVSGIQTLMYSLDDAENALPIQATAPLNDVTFLRASIQPVRLWLHVDQMAMLCQIDSSRIEFNDWARHRFSERLHVVIPSIILAAVEGKAANRRRARSVDQESVITFGYLQTSVDVRMVSSKANFRDSRQKQQEHLRLQDLRTMRTPWLLGESELMHTSDYAQQLAKMQPPASPFPPMPDPLQERDTRGLISRTEDRSPISITSTRGRPRKSSKFQKPQRNASQARTSSARTATASGEVFTHDHGSSSRSSVWSSASPIRTSMAPASTSVNVTFASSYEQPYFPLLHVRPSSDDVPEVHIPATRAGSWTTIDAKADEMPLEDDDMEHMTLMIALQTGLRLVCTPPALRAVNTLLAKLQNRTPDSLLDVLQMRSLDDVIAKKRQAHVPKITQLRLHVPGMALRFRHHVPAHLTQEDRQQTYEVAMGALLVAARFGADRGKVLGKTPSSMHASVEKLELEACRTASTGLDEARVLLKLTGLTSWLYEAEENTGELKFRTLETASLNQKIANLASLVNSAGTMANRLSQDFSSTITSQSSRLQLLVYTLSDLGQHVADPPILSSASFVSRRWEELVRTSDSWKMMMRLRWILQSMNADSVNELSQTLHKNQFDLPLDTPSRIVAYFQRWRSWDLDHIRSSSLMQVLYGSSAPAHQDKSRMRAKPVRFSFASETISLVIDPGKRKNRVVVEGLGAALQSDLQMSGTRRDSNQELADHLVRKSTLEVSCERGALEVKLDLLSAIGDIIAHVEGIKATQPVTEAPLSLRDTGPPVEQQFHVVLGVKRNEVRIKTRHLRVMLETNDFGTSVAGTMAAEKAMLATMLTTARSSSVKIKTASKDLFLVIARGSSVYGDLNSRSGTSGALNRWKIGAQCQRIELDVLENALGLLGVADQVIGQEVIFLQKFVNGLQSSDDTRPLAAGSPPAAQDIVQISLHLSSYCITTVLFSTLYYRLEGKETRSSLTPGSVDQDGHIFDFDVSHHAHSVFNNEEGNIYEVSRLPLPPINGRVAFKQRERLSIDVAVEMSKIALDASAVHGLFTTLSRTELMQFGENIMRDVEVVKANYQIAMMGAPAPTSPCSPTSFDKPIQSSPTIAYSASVGLAGVAILATSSKSLKTSAELVVDSGPIHFGIRNSHAHTGAILPFPDLDLQLDEIGVLLESLRENHRDRCGSITLSVALQGTSEVSDSNQIVRGYRVVAASLSVDIYTETASMIVDILGYLQQRFKHFNLSEELHTLRARRRKRAKSHVKASDLSTLTYDKPDEDIPVALFDAIFMFQMHTLQVIWHVGDGQPRTPVAVPENLVFSIQKIDLHTKKGNTARLEIQNLQLQMAPTSQAPTERSKNSALLPEVVFKVAYISRSRDRRIALQAIGKALDLRLTSQFILPAVNIQKSIAVATQDLRKVLSDWNETLIQGDSAQKSVLGDKRLASLAVDADFAGAVVYMEGKDVSDPDRKFVGNRGVRAPREGKYGQFTQANSRSTTTLRSPGLAFRIEYSDAANAERHLNGELKVAASNNELQPMFVPLVLEILASVKDVVGDSSDITMSETALEQNAVKKVSATESTTDPTTILGDTKLNLGLRICQQSFSLTCKPIAQVTATARFQDIYIAVSTVQPANQERFFSVSSAISGFETTVQHVYSRESTGRFKVDTIYLSLMNSKHLGGMTGISSILNVSPMEVFLNVKQLQDFLLFREIWYPVEIRPTPQAPSSRSQSPVKGGVQRFQEVTASNTFSWNAAINIAALNLSLDLGQAVGKLSFSISRLWITSRKDSEREQNLCLGFDSTGMESVGRMSGSIQLRNMRVRTNIVWPESGSVGHTPLVQASLGFDDLRAKMSFDYQAFAVANFQTLSFLLYNVTDCGRDRLVCTVNGDKIQAFCTANAAAQGVALYQAINRLIEEKQAAFQASLKEMEKFQRQKAAAGMGLSSSQELSRSVIAEKNEEPQVELAPMRLQVNVVVSLNALRAGVYPRAFRDAQIFKLEALDALARFRVTVDGDGRVHTLLTVVLGQLRVALSAVERTGVRVKVLGDNVAIDDVVKDSTASRGGTILKVPRVVATMQTWQSQASKNVEYLFKSTFEGKVEVGWNYSRISFIRGMWDTHSKALVQRLGKLPASAVQITSSPRSDALSKDKAEEAQEKITAVVNVPVSKYIYDAREPPVIQTPQLRDMGEATPPLEWIGLQREKLPHLTHQVIIVPLLQFSKEVEDAYSKILGAS